MWIGAGFAPVAQGYAGEIVTSHFTAASLKREWAYNIYLPTGYAENTRHYPVIYLLHGVADDAASWVNKGGIDVVADELIASGQMRAAILVMPVAGRSWYVNGPERMEAAFIGDLLPEIDRIYRTRPDRADRMIAGVSMGGYGAMRLALRYPDRFSAVALMSPAIYSPDPPVNSAARNAPPFQIGGVFDSARWEAMNYPALLDDFIRSGYRMRVQLTAGLQDRLETGPAAERFAAALRARGVGADIRMFPGGHDFALWRNTLPLALRFLSGPSRMLTAIAGRAPGPQR